MFFSKWFCRLFLIHTHTFFSRPKIPKDQKANFYSPFLWQTTLFLKEYRSIVIFFFVVVPFTYVYNIIEGVKFPIPNKIKCIVHKYVQKDVAKCKYKNFIPFSKWKKNNKNKIKNRRREIRFLWFCSNICLQHARPLLVSPNCDHSYCIPLMFLLVFITWLWVSSLTAQQMFQQQQKKKTKTKTKKKTIPNACGDRRRYRDLYHTLCKNCD